MMKTVELTWRQAGIIDALLEDRLDELEKMDGVLAETKEEVRTLTETFDKLCWDFRMDELEEEIVPNRDRIKAFEDMVQEEFEDEFWDIDMLGC